jgi:DNA-binding PadR family transcriptional regulator
MFHHHFHRHRHCGEDEMQFMGRHHGPRGFGRFAGGFGEGPGGPAFRTGRKLAAGDLQLVILALLAEKPSHGYELIKALEERSHGFYSPSPGMVYPALTYLEEIGYASVESAGARKLYQITAEGRAHLEANRTAADTLLTQIDRVGSRMEQVRRVFAGEAAAEDEDGEPAGRNPAHREAWLARHELKAALRAKRHSTPEEYRRIAEILRRAAEEISRGKAG